MTKHINLIIIFVALYIAFQIFADISSLRILFLFGLSIDGGTLIYPLTFTIRDILHRLTNKQTTYTVIGISAFLNLLMIGLFFVVAKLPADLFVGEQLNFGIVLLPAFNIVIASITAELISEFVDANVYEKFNTPLKRVLFSNLISVPLDSFIFVLIAFVFVLPFSVVVSIFFTNVVVKFFMSLVFYPVYIWANNNVSYSQSN